MAKMQRVGAGPADPSVDSQGAADAAQSADALALALLGHACAPALQDLSPLHLRLERGRRLGAGAATARVLVLMSWTRQAVRRGEVQAMAVLEPAAAAALRRACTARGLRFVDNA